MCLLICVRPSLFTLRFGGHAAGQIQNAHVAQCTRSAAHLQAFWLAVLSDVLVYMHKPEFCCMHVRQVGVDKIRLRGKLRVTLPLFDELPCVAGIQASALPLPISHIMFQRIVFSCHCCRLCDVAVLVASFSTSCVRQIGRLSACDMLRRSRLWRCRSSTLI